MSNQGNNSQPEVTSDHDHADDVATLYSWANLGGVKYRDFSEERQQRHLQGQVKATKRPKEPVAEVEAPETSVGSSSHAGEASDARSVAGNNAAEEDEMPQKAQDPTPVRRLAGDLEVRSGNHRWKAYEAAPGADPSEGPHVVPARQPEFDQPAAHAFPLETALGNTALQWPVLQGLFAPTRDEDEFVESGSSLSFPPLVFASVAGGTGKTNLVANLGSILASDGESTLLVETSPAGVLPYYFGGSEPRTGVVRTFTSDSEHAPVQVLTLGRGECSGNPASDRQAYNALVRFGKEPLRVILDVAGDPLEMLRQILALDPVIVVPVVPDTRSVLGLQMIEDVQNGNRKNGFGKSTRVCYLLNRFDSSLPLHRDIREMMKERFGNRLLPFVIRQSSLVDEALAHGVTVFDYAPESGVAQDLQTLAGWVRSTIRAHASAPRLPRWSER